MKLRNNSIFSVSLDDSGEAKDKYDLNISQNINIQRFLQTNHIFGPITMFPVKIKAKCLNFKTIYFEYHSLPDKASIWSYEFKNQ